MSPSIQANHFSQPIIFIFKIFQPMELRDGIQTCDLVHLMFTFQIALSMIWSRTDINFDFGWRHRLGATRRPNPPPAPTPPVGCTGKYAFKSTQGQCLGLNNYAAATSATECEAYCCGNTLLCASKIIVCHFHSLLSVFLGLGGSFVVVISNYGSVAFCSRRVFVCSTL